MDLWNPLPQFEATFYRRACPIPSGIIDPISSITYHNHILVGNHIWFIQKPLRSKDVGKHRLVLVQGTRRGRLQGLHLSNESVIQCGRQDQIYMTPLHYDVDTSTSAIISDSSVAMQSSSQSASSLATTAMWLQRLHQQLQQHPLPHKTSSNESNTTYYSIEISGMSLSTHSLEKWQLITLSAEVYIAWAEALLRARNIVNILEASGEWYKLQVLTKRMKECLVIRRRLSRFRFYDKSFIGVRAVKWLMEDKQCSRIQALAIGNRLLNLGFINHVNYEHLFYARHLLYQFADDILDSPFLPGSAGLLSNGNEPVVSNIHASTGKPRSMVAWAKQSIRSNATSSALQHQASNESNASSNAVNEQPVNQVPVEEYDILVDEHHRVLANYHQLQYDLILYQTHLKTVLQQVPSLHNVVSHHQHREQHQSQVVQEVFRRLCVLFLLLTLLWITTHEASSPTFAMQLETALQFVHGLLFIALVVLVALTLKMLYNEVFPSIATSEWTWKEHFQALISSVFKLKLSQSTVLPESIEIDKEWKQICKAFKHTEESYKMHQHNKATYSHMDVNVNEAGVEESNADADRSDEEEEETAVKAVTDEKRAHKKAMISEDDLLDEDEDEDDDDDDLEDDEAIIKHGIEQEEVLLDEDEDEDEDGDELGEGPDVDGDSDDENMTIISLDSYTLPNPSKKQGPSNAKHSSSSKSVVSRYLPSTNWPTYPLLLLRGGSHQVPTANTNVEKQQLLMQPLRLFDPSSTPEARPLKSEHAPMTLLVDIDSDHFVGRMFLTFCNLHPVQHTSSTSNHGTDSSGSPQKNNYHYRSVIQGRFKHPLPFAKVYTGQAFDEAIPHLPVHWLIRGISKLQPGSKSFLMGEKPYFISPLIATSQHVVISKVGEEPSIFSDHFEDQLQQLGADFVNMPTKKRKAYFTKYSNLLQHSYDPQYVYTFDFYQHLFNFATFQIELGFFKYDAIKILGSLPIQIMSVVWDPIESNGVPPEQWQFLYNVEAYHQRSLTADLMVHNHSSNNDYTTEHSSTGAKPPLRRASKNQSVLASDQNATNTSESFQSPVQGGRPLEGIATLTTQHASSEHTLHQLFAPATPPISTPSLTIPIGDAQPHSSGTPKSSRRPSGASALVGIFRKQVKEDSSPPSSPSDTYHANYASPSPTQKKRKSWLGRITPNTTTSNI